MFVHRSRHGDQFRFAPRSVPTDQYVFMNAGVRFMAYDVNPAEIRIETHGMKFAKRANADWLPGVHLMLYKWKCLVEKLYKRFRMPQSKKKTTNWT